MQGLLSKARRRRGMTLPEMMISLAIFSTVGLFVTFITLEIAKQTRESLSMVPAQQEAYRAMDFVRRELLPSTFGTLVITNDGRTVSFRNPSRGGVTSRINFLEDERVCEFIPNVANPSDNVIWGRRLVGSFRILDTPRRINVSVVTIGYNAKREAVPIRYSDDLTVRN